MKYSLGDLVLYHNKPAIVVTEQMLGDLIIIQDNHLITGVAKEDAHYIGKSSFNESVSKMLKQVDKVRQEHVGHNILSIVKELEYCLIAVNGVKYMMAGDYKQVNDKYYILVKDNECQQHWFELSSFLLGALGEPTGGINELSTDVAEEITTD